jgi:uncharacterized membrane protein YhaH (DUF805 family)
MQIRRLCAAAVSACALVCSTLLEAQRDDASGAAGCAACSGCGGLFILIWIGLIGLQIALLVWVARDAKARGMDSAILWMLLVMFVPLLGIVIYLFARPQGNMVQCANCGNKRLQASVKCPHCGIGS